MEKTIVLYRKLWKFDILWKKLWYSEKTMVLEKTIDKYGKL